MSFLLSSYQKYIGLCFILKVPSLLEHRFDERTDYVFAVVELSQCRNVPFDGEHHFLSVCAIRNIQHFLDHIIGERILHHFQQWWI